MSTKKNLRHYIVLGVIFVFLGVAFLAGSVLREQEPNFYAPGRTALINARLSFEESMIHERASIEQRRMSRKEINSAMILLAEAEGLDPADKVKIENLRNSLLEIEKVDHMSSLSPKELKQQYQDLLDQIDALISELENRQ